MKEVFFSFQSWAKFKFRELLTSAFSIFTFQEIADSFDQNCILHRLVGRYTFVDRNCERRF